MATHAASTIETEHPPLARDASGHLLPVPDGTCAWRICRQTTGRPRIIVGPDKQPMRFPLDVTPDELLELCGPDTYRVYALDDVGNVIDHVATVDLTRAGRELRNAPAAVSVTPALRAVPFEATSDLRFALEAIAHIARINGEALRAVSESQADWVKAIAVAKGLPRNVAFPPPPSRDRDRDDDDDDDDDDDADDGVEQAPSASEPKSTLEVLLANLGPHVQGFLDEWRKKNLAANDPRTPAFGVAHLARVNALLDHVERKYLDELLADPEAGPGIASAFAEQSVEDVVRLIRREARKPLKAVEPMKPTLDMSKLREKAMAVMSRLEPEEKLRVMRLAAQLQKHDKNPELAALVDELLPLSHDESVIWLREHIDELEQRFAS
jgi:hypothetical protein